MPDRRIGILSQLVPPKTDWTEEKVPSQEGKTVIITGGNIGIGKQTARVLLEKGARVYIATRSAEKAQRAIDELKGCTMREDVFFLPLNLADLDSVKAAAEEFMQKEPELHTLYNNRGVSVAKAEQKTRQGYDTLFGSNVLGHFYLTKLLLPVLRAAVKGSPPGTVRVVNLSSIAHYMSPSDGIRWSTLGPGEDAVAARKTLGAPRLLGQSKLGNILVSGEFSRQYKEDGIMSFSVFPGAVNADLAGYADSFWRRSLSLIGTCCCFILSGGNIEDLAGDLRPEDAERGLRAGTQMAEQNLRSGAESTVQRHVRQNSVFSSDDPEPDEPLLESTKVYHRAITSLHAGTDPGASRHNGKYFTAWARVTLPSRKGLDRKLATDLWKWCEDQVVKYENAESNDVATTPIVELPRVAGSPVAEEDTKPKGDIKFEKDTNIKFEEDTKLKGDIKVEEDTKIKVEEEDTKIKIEEDTKPKEDIKVEEATKVDDITKVDDVTKADEPTKAKDDTEAKEDTKSKE